MNRELEAFRRFRDNAKFDNKTDYYLSTQYIDDSDIIETAIERLIEYDEIGVKFAILNDSREKKLKALEIIKEKRVDITTLFDCLNAEEYNRWVPVRSHYSYPPLELTQEEYDLLKEVLLCK